MDGFGDFLIGLIVIVGIVFALGSLGVIAGSVYSIAESVGDIHSDAMRAADALDRIAQAAEDKAGELPPEAIDIHGFEKYFAKSVDGADPEAVEAVPYQGGLDFGFESAGATPGPHGEKL